MSEKWSSDESWEAGSDSSDDDIDVDKYSPEKCCTVLCDLLLSLYYSGGLTAKALCTIFFWMFKAGLQYDSVRAVMFRPDAQSGHYQRHLDSVLGLRSESTTQSFYFMEVPMYSEAWMGRRLNRIPVFIPHAELHEEMKESITFDDDLAHAISHRTMPPSYFNHTVVSGTTDRVAPIAMYVDGVQFQKTDSVLGLWVHNLIIKKRHLICSLKKSHMCKCGCKGWCTLYAVFNFFRWSFSAAASGVFPAARHDGPWSPIELGFALAGTALVYKMAVIQLKTDWAEVYTFGLSTWKSLLFPCYMCYAESGGDVETITDAFAEELPWRDIEESDYETACTRCEVKVTATREQQCRLKPLLMYDKREQGSLGLSLSHAFAELGLIKGDRLEPVPDHPDVGEVLSKFGKFAVLALVFWRRGNETFVRRRNPLFLVPGLSCELMLADVLHCVWLGTAQAWLVAALFVLFDANVFQCDGPQEVRDQLSILRLRAVMGKWYSDCQRCGVDVTSIRKLTLSMLGNRRDHARQPFKAAQAKGFSPLVARLLEEHHIAGDVLAAGQHLMAFSKIIDEQPVNFSSDEVWRALTRSAVAHVVTSIRAGARPIKKHHQILHLAHRARIHGNPSFYAHWTDESLNKELAAIAHVSYASVWYVRLLSHWRHSRAVR